MAETYLGTVSELTQKWGLESSFRVMYAHYQDTGILSCPVNSMSRSIEIAGYAYSRRPLIKLHSALLEDGRGSDRNSTFLHECAHIIADRRYKRSCNHNSYWKQIAISLGDDGERCHNYAYLSLKQNPDRIVATYACLACSKEFNYARKPKYPAERYICQDCRGRLTDITEDAIEIDFAEIEIEI